MIFFHYGESSRNYSAMAKWRNALPWINVWTTQFECRVFFNTRDTHKALSSIKMRFAPCFFHTFYYYVSILLSSYLLLIVCPNRYRYFSTQNSGEYTLYNEFFWNSLYKVYRRHLDCKTLIGKYLVQPVFKTGCTRIICRQFGLKKIDNELNTW